MRAFAALLALVPAGAYAQTPDELRASCEPFLTVVYEGCRVENFSRCADGSTYSETYEQGEPPSLSLVDAEANTLFSLTEVLNDGMFSLEIGPDPISISQLLETGRDTFSQTAQMGIEDVGSWKISFDGTYILDGGRVVIDGVSLLTGTVTLAAILQTVPPSPISLDGEIFVDPATMMIILGDSIAISQDATEDDQATPQQFIWLGESGFFSTDLDTICAPTLSKEAPSP
ncbi:MAG: hypothetical protein JKX69_06520 [Rhodobacteraceae bacterium]|nr:hypothetical protein [Paracoccaceae bacterium]